MSNVMLGRDGIKLLCGLFGIDCKKVRRLTVTADHNDVVTIDLTFLAVAVSQSIDVIGGEGGHDEISKYEITVKKINDNSSD